MSDSELAQLSDTLLSWTILVYALALLGYAVEHAFGSRSRAARPARAAAYAGPAGSPGAVLPDGPGPASGSGSGPGDGAPEWFGRAALALTVLGALLNLAVMVTRGLAADRVPWGNMYEFVIAACLVGVTVWLVVVLRSGEQVRRLGGFVILPVLLLLGLAALVLYVPAGPLVPALDSNWLKIHVLAAVIASGTFLVSFVASVLFLLRDRFEAATEAGVRPGVGGRMGARLPDADRLDTLSHRTIVFAFPIWTFAVIAGAIWAESAWGRYWNWDPKETWSAISWLVYAGYLHARATAGWSGRRAAWISVIAFSTMIINLFVVNFVVSGLHSYA